MKNLLIIIFSLVSWKVSFAQSPLLILGGESNFGLYTGEILKNEGFKSYKIDSFSGGKITPGYLKQFDVIILPESSISASQEELLKGYVKNGGNLISFKPGNELAELFGLNKGEGSVSEGYISIDQKNAEGKGLISKVLKFHGSADKFSLNKGAIILASLYDEKKTGTGFPAVVSYKYGKGKAIAFLYNLPKSVVYTRQGNPEFAGIEKDGINGLRGMDLFTDGWVDPEQNVLNPADEQMRLLTRCIETMTATKKPLPRLWYFPDGMKSLITLTNDGEYNTAAEFDPQFSDVDAKGAKMTIYLLALNRVTKEFVDKWAERGHEMVGHPDDTKEAGNPRWQKMDSVLRVKTGEIRDNYGIIQRTNTNHWFVWCGRDTLGNQDFTAQAKLESRYGIELDCNYAHYDNGSTQGRFLGPMGYNQGNYWGSGMVMKFCDDKGKIVNVYQHFNNVYDQQYSENKDTTGFFQCFKGLMDRSLNEEVYSFLSIKSHNWAYPFSKKPLMQMIDYANERGIPVWTAKKLLDFIKMKDEANFTDIKWSGNKLSFKLNSSLGFGKKLSFMIPEKYRDKKVSSLTANGVKVTTFSRTIKGNDYTMGSVEPGQNHDIVVTYN